MQKDDKKKDTEITDGELPTYRNPHANWLREQLARENRMVPCKCRAPERMAWGKSQGDPSL